MCEEISSLSDLMHLLKVAYETRVGIRLHASIAGETAESGSQPDSMQS